jgi:hypothetical protein
MSPRIRRAARLLLGQKEITTYRQAVRVMVVRSVLILGTMLALYALLPFDTDHWWVAAIVGGASVLAIVPLTVRRVQALQISERPIIEAVEALVLLLGLLIFGFASVYLTLDRSGTAMNGMHTRLDSLYYTVTTLSTVGYGDITPRTQAARATATVQMIFDLAFIAFAVRVLASVAQQRHAATRVPSA